MLIYPIHALQPSFGPSIEAIGLLEHSQYQIIFSNNAFAEAIERIRIDHSKHVLNDWPALLAALSQCISLDTTAHLEHTDWNLRAELIPIKLQHTDGTLEQVVQCKLLDLSPVTDVTTNLLEWSPHSSWACTLTGDVFWTNRASNLFTYGQEVVHDLTNTRYIEKIHPDDLQRTSENFGDIMVQGKCTPFRYRLRDHQGQFHWFLFTAAPVLAKDGSIRLWTGSSINIQAFVDTESRLEAEIEQLKAQLHAAQATLASTQKVELLSQLAAGVTHDLNNLLFVMRMHLGSLNGKLQEPSMLNSLQVINDCIRNASRMSSQLSAFSGRLPQNAAPLDVRNVISEAQPLFEKAAGAETQFSIAVEPQVSFVLADRSYLENALINLLINARHALDGRGKIHLSITTELSDAQGNPGSYIAFRVQDNGPGISPEVQKNIFQPFFTTKGPSQGSGLGLAMVKNFVENSGGQLVLDSTVGQGTTIGFLLPVTALIPEVAERSIESALLTTGRASILLVEDDETVRQAVSMRLRELGYAIVCVPNPDTAIRYLENGVIPDVILSDIRMPGKKTVLDMITYVEAHLNTPMIFITGYSADVIIREGLIADRHPVLFKPFSIDDLVLKIQALLAQRRSSQQSSDLQDA